MVYLPAEDSILLSKWVQKYSFGDVLDIGTGSGIQAITASKNAKKVVAVDIDCEALAYAKNEAEKIKCKNLEFRQSDLFSNIGVGEKFDLIIFNPPYLPEDRMDGGIDTTGGRKGNEIIIRFLQMAKKRLKPYGRILLLFSSLSGKEEIDSILNKLLYKFVLLESQHVAFEDLYVYEVTL